MNPSAGMQVPMRRWLGRAAWVPLLVMIVVTGGWVGLQAMGLRSLVVLSGSMEPALAPGDVAIVDVIPARAARQFDVVSFRDPSRENRLVTHRVVATLRAGDRIAFLTKGDANTGTEQWTVAADGTIGRLAMRVPKLGYVLIWLGSPRARIGLLAAAFVLLGGIAVRLTWRVFNPAVHPAPLAIAILLGLLIGGRALPSTLAAYSSTTSNAGNTFQAAPAFCTAGMHMATVSEDASVKQSNPTNNYDNESDLFVKSKTGDNKRVLVKFTMPALPLGCNVTGATLSLYENSVQGTRTIEAWRVAANWTETAVTWATQPASMGTPVTVSNVSGWRSWNVTSAVTAMYAGGNYGFLIKDQNEDGSPDNGSYENKFDSRNNTKTGPMLLISYGSGAPCGALGVQRVLASADATVKQSNPTNNYENENELFVKSKAADDKRVLVNFGLPASGACTVTGAVLHMWERTTQGTRTLEVRGASSAWTEGGVTWANQPGLNSTPATVTNVDGWRDWIVGPIVKAMYAGTSFGFVVKDQAENGSPDNGSYENKFSSRNDALEGPELFVGYQQ